MARSDWSLFARSRAERLSSAVTRGTGVRVAGLWDAGCATGRQEWLDRLLIVGLTLLHIDSSADLSGSVSRRLTARFAGGGRSRGHQVFGRDLFLDQPPHLPTAALHWAPSLRVAGESVEPADEKYQQQLCGELLDADVVLLGAPMYNWSVPSPL